MNNYCYSSKQCFVSIENSPDTKSKDCDRCLVHLYQLPLNKKHRPTVARSLLTQQYWYKADYNTCKPNLLYNRVWTGQSQGNERVWQLKVLVSKTIITDISNPMSHYKIGVVSESLSSRHSSNTSRKS